MSLKKLRIVGLGALALAVASWGNLSRAEESGWTATNFEVHHTAPAEVAEVYQFANETFGFVPNLTKVMAGSPALLNSYIGTQKNLKAMAKLNQAEINIVQMSIAVENQCKYCTAGHTMAGRMFFKTPEADMQAICQRRELSDPKQRALQRFAMLLYHGRGHVSEAEMETFLAAGYTREQALDVVACVAAKVMSNYTNALAKTEIDEPIKPIAAQLNFAKR